MLTSPLLTSLCDFILTGQHLQDKCLSISPIAESLHIDSAISTLLISQRAQYVNNPELAKYLDPPSQSEWGLTIWWLYLIHGRLHPRPPLTP